jgi:hypothetical protein
MRQRWSWGRRTSVVETLRALDPVCRLDPRAFLAPEQPPTRSAAAERVRIDKPTTRVRLRIL